MRKRLLPLHVFLPLCLAAGMPALAAASDSPGAPAESAPAYRDPSTGMVFVLVEGGCFRMGTAPSDPRRYDNEGPRHEVCVNDFWMGVYEVTQAQWKAVMGSNPSTFPGDENPVERVSWENAQDFIEKLNRLSGAAYRLPTEAEWEYAARGGKLDRDCTFAGSCIIAEVAWYKGNEGGQTHPVGSKAPNELGLYDMSGNVWEWCQDWYEPEYTVPRGKEDPQGPLSGLYHVVRGGSWRSDSRMVKTSARYRNASYFRSGNLGFRLVFSRQKVLSALFPDSAQEFFR